MSSYDTLPPENSETETTQETWISDAAIYGASFSVLDAVYGEMRAGFERWKAERSLPDAARPLWTLTWTYRTGGDE